MDMTTDNTAAEIAAKLADEMYNELSRVHAASNYGNPTIQRILWQYREYKKAYAALSTVPAWRKIDPHNFPRDVGYYLLRRDNYSTLRCMSELDDWVNAWGICGLTHYMPESDILSLPKE